MKKYRGMSILTSIGIAILAIASLIILDAYGKSRRVYHQAGRLTDSYIEKILVQTPGEAFTAWKDRGFTGRAVVYVAGEWARLDNAYDAPVSRPYPLRLFRLSDRWAPAELTSTNFLFSATLNRIIRKISVILPEDELKKVTDRARTTKDFQVNGDVLSFPYQGLQRRFTTSKGFKRESEPALLYVSASYFRSKGPEELYQNLVGTGLETDSIILCGDIEDKNVTDAERDKLVRFAELIGWTPEPGATDDAGTIHNAQSVILRQSRRI